MRENEIYMIYNTCKLSDKMRQKEVKEDEILI